MVRIAIVEDEELYIDQLTGYLEDYQRETGEELDVTVYRDGDEITARYKAQFHIIFLDIQMKFVDGMSAAEEIRRQDSEVIIIFITSMAQYAIKGYEVGAMDYILKPVSYFAFGQRLSRAITKIRKRSSTYITIPLKGGIQRLDISDIYYIESVGHDLIFHTGKEQYVASLTLKSIEEKLAPYGFFRGNKCYLINLKHVEGVRDRCAIVKGEKLQLSRPRYSEFMQELTRFWGDL